MIANYLPAIQEISLQKLKIYKQLTFKDGLKLAAGIGLTYTIYKAVSNILYRRKYRHIPGPPLNG